MLKKLAPWVVAAAILGFLFWKIPIGDSWAAARQARLELFVPALLGAVLLWFWIESGAFAYLFSRFNAPLSWREARALRGTTYLLTPINWNLGTAAIILHLRRSKEIGAVESSSSMLFYGLLDGIVLSGLALLGLSQLPESPELAAVRRGALAFVGLIATVLAFFMLPAPGWGWLLRLRGYGIFRTHALADPRDVAILVAMRALYFSVFVAIFWLGPHAFGVPVPLAVTTAATPAILVVTALPITPAGLGTQAAAMIYFFGAYGDEAAILAFGLAFPVGQALARVLLGLRYVSYLGELRREPLPAE